MSDKCEHDWLLEETGYVRTWRLKFDGKSVTALWGGSENFSDIGNQDDHLVCNNCLVTRQIPEDWEIDFQ